MSLAALFLSHATQVPTSSVSVVAMVPGSVVATLSIAVIDHSQPAATMYATLQVNSASAFDSAFMAEFGVTGLAMQQLNHSASLLPFPPTPPPAPPLAAGKAVDASPSGTGATPTGTVTATPAGAAAATPDSSTGGTSSSAAASTTVIVLATVLSVMGAALVATVAVVLVRRNRTSAAKLTASPSDRMAALPATAASGSSSPALRMPSVECDEGCTGVRQGSHLDMLEHSGTGGVGGMRASRVIAASEGGAAKVARDSSVTRSARSNSVFPV